MMKFLFADGELELANFPSDHVVESLCLFR